MDRDDEEFIQLGTHVFIFGPHEYTNHISMGVTNLFGVLLQSSITLKIPMFDASNVYISPYLPGESFLKDLHPKNPRC